MDQSQFAERIATIRSRFASRLAGKIEETEAAMEQLVGNGSDAVAAVATTYRRFHDVCGIGATIGFEATGRWARTLDAILVGPFRDRRGLSEEELSHLKEGLASLRVAARVELETTGSDQGLAS
jgi:hypothetical protein